MERHLHRNKMVFGKNTSQNVVDGAICFCVSATVELVLSVDRDGLICRSMSQETIGQNNQSNVVLPIHRKAVQFSSLFLPSFFFLTYNRYKERKITKRLRLQPTVTVLYEIIYMRDLLIAPPLHTKQLR